MATLHTDLIGRGHRLALLHGFTQTNRCWGPIAEDLASDHGLVLVDMPGHGRSADVDTDLVDGARMIAETVDTAVYLGYSMGGRFALQLAMDHPDVVEALVVVGATAGIEDDEERAARRDEDEARARRIEEIGVDAFVDEWLSLPLFDGLPDDLACREERRANTASGLASSLRRAGTGSQPPGWDRLPSLRMPVLVVAGSRDEKFATIGARLAERIGDNATFATIDGAGHTAHLEQPQRFLGVLRPWLAERGLTGVGT